MKATTTSIMRFTLFSIEQSSRRREATVLDAAKFKYIRITTCIFRYVWIPRNVRDMAMSPSQHRGSLSSPSRRVAMLCCHCHFNGFDGVYCIWCTDKRALLPCDWIRRQRTPRKAASNKKKKNKTKFHSIGIWKCWCGSNWIGRYIHQLDMV